MGCPTTRGKTAPGARPTANQGGGVLLRSDRFHGWVLTVGGNFNDGSGYGGDGKANSKCKACAVAASDTTESSNGYHY